MKYVYTATFEQVPGSNQIMCSIPDIPGCVTSGFGMEEAIDMITDAAGGCLVVMEDELDSVPEPTPQSKITVPTGATVSYITVDTKEFRKGMGTQAVRRNVSLPLWLAKLADKRGINCSKVLQDGLMNVMGV